MAPTDSAVPLSQSNSRASTPPPSAANRPPPFPAETGPTTPARDPEEAVGAVSQPLHATRRPADRWRG